MTSGYGFVAVAVVLFAAWRPVRVLGGAYLFGIVLAAASVLQAHGVSVNQYLLDALPYLVTLVVLAVFARRGRSDTPEALVRSLIQKRLARARSVADRPSRHRPYADHSPSPSSITRKDLSCPKSALAHDSSGGASPWPRSAVALLAACASSIEVRRLVERRLDAACAAAAAASDATTASGTVGFIMVGSHSDYGYNEAVYDASQKLAKDDPNVKVITADNIPETDAVTQTMQSMVDKGAKVIFATSYGYFTYAEKFAAAHPDVVDPAPGRLRDRAPSRRTSAPTGARRSSRSRSAAWPPAA